MLKVHIFLLLKLKGEKKQLKKFLKRKALVLWVMFNVNRKICFLWRCTLKGKKQLKILQWNKNLATCYIRPREDIIHQNKSICFFVQSRSSFLSLKMKTIPPSPSKTGMWGIFVKKTTSEYSLKFVRIQFEVWIDQSTRNKQIFWGVVYLSSDLQQYMSKLVPDCGCPRSIPNNFWSVLNNIDNNNS